MKSPLLVSTAIGLTVVFGFMAWTVYASSRVGVSWGTSGFIWTMIGFGAIGAGALTGVLMWLAFYSSRRGYDEPPGLEDQNSGSAKRR